MTGSLYISVDAINPPSLAAPSKLQFAAANGSQPVALVYTDFDAYRPPAGLKLMGNQGGEWLEAPLLIGDKLVTATSLKGSNPHEGFVVSLYNGASYANQNSSVIGTVKITLPFGWNNGMNVYKIMIYEYNGRGASEITVSGYNYNSESAWYNYTTQVNGAFEGAIRLGYDGSRCCILLGDTSYNWNYPQIYVHQVFSGFGGNNSDIDGAYSISIITSETGLSSVTSVPKTSMNKGDTNFIRALNKNGYYGMAIVGDSDNVYIRAPRLGIIPYSSGNPGEGMLGTEGWQFTHIYVNQTKTQRVSSVTHNLYIGSSGNSGWVYCQDICSANGAAEAYWSIRTNGSAVFTNLTSKNIITGNIDGYATYLPTRYNGGTQANPQTYFSQHMGLRVAMTGIGFGGPWSDTLWINGYSGNDVLPMCALHTVRDGTPQMYISTQKSDATSYGTMYLFYTSYNANKSDRPWICSTLNAYGRITTTSDIYSQSWVRTVGTTGWYSESYGGGIYMEDSTWLRVYNSKQFLVTSGSADSIHTYGGMNASGRIYSGGILTTSGGLDVVGVRASTGVSNFNVYGRFYGNGQHGGIEIGASDNVLGIGVHSNDSWYLWWTNSGSVDSTSNKSYIFNYNGGSWSFTGNILATGGVTAKSTSDMRLKIKLESPKSYKERILELGPVFDYQFNSLAKSRVGKNADSLNHIGLGYQMAKVSMPVITGLDEDGYGYINYIHPDLIALSIGAIQEIISEEYTIKKDIDSLKNRVRQLESENKQLKERLGLIA